MFSDEKIKKSYEKVIKYYIYEIKSEKEQGIIDYIVNDGFIRDFFKNFIESFRNKKIPGKGITYFDYVKQEILEGCNHETKAKLKQIMEEGFFKKAFDMIFSNLLVIPLFKGEQKYYDFDQMLLF